MVLCMMKSIYINNIKKRLNYIYPSQDVFSKFEKILHKVKIKNRKLTDKDAILITYGDSIVGNGKPLWLLHRFLKKYVGKSISTVHILPFFPYSSDDGFSIIDYKKVNPRLGGWADIRKIGKDYRLMADLVMNHISVKSKWFKGFLKGEKKYKDYFISFDKRVDTSSVFRPRIHPLLTSFNTKLGKQYVWTTFSADQVDLNFSNPEVLLEMVKVLLFYLSQGIDIIRLDAVGFVWKELGTSCFHLKKTHEIVKLLRDIMEYVAPGSVLITETNVPYEDNISYFGKNDEAHMVYNFSLPPLVFDAFNRGDNKHLVGMYKRLEKLDNKNLMFNFLASHDGIGVLGAKDFLSRKEYDKMLAVVVAHKGRISYKSACGGKVPYEMNINYFDAINDPSARTRLDVRKFIASQAIMVLGKGVPGIYIHSLIGSRNYLAGVRNSGINRRINREKIKFDQLEKELKDKKSLRYNVLNEYKKLLKMRKRGFDPYTRQKVMKSDSRVLVLKGRKKCMINMSGETVGDLEPYSVVTD